MTRTTLQIDETSPLVAKMNRCKATANGNAGVAAAAAAAAGAAPGAVGRKTFRVDEDSTAPPPPPPPGSSSFSTQQQQQQQSQQTQTQRFMMMTTRTKNRNLGSLDFERIVNDYSIQAKRDLLLLDQRRRQGGTKDAGGDDDDDDDDEEDVDVDVDLIAGPSFDHLRCLPKRPTHYRQERRQQLLDGRNTTRWALTVACGVLSGLTTVMIVSATEILVDWRTQALDDILNAHRSSVLVGFVAYCGVSWAMAVVACLLCLYVAPAAVGSGIPEVKAYLNGIRIKKFNDSKLLAVKMVGSVLSVASSLATGMEGPLVFMGAIVGASLSHVGTFLSWALTSERLGCTAYQWPWLTRLWIWSTSDLSYFANDMERRNLVTIGAACGFAASFGAPIGGLLFVLDDISSFIEQSMFLRVLVANAVATFCLALYRGDLSSYGSIQFGIYDEPSDNIFVDRFVEIPFWIVMGVGGGVLGGYFCRAFQKIKQWSDARFTTNVLHLVRVSYITLVTCVVMFFLPMMKWTCHNKSEPGDTLSTDDFISGIVTVSATTGAVEHGRRFFCDDGQVNEMATIMFGSRNQAIVRILSHPSEFYPLTLTLVGLVFFILMAFSNTLSIPSGMFTPIVLSGASLGGAVGLYLERYVDGGINPSTFALLGVASLMAGVQRSTVSTCVILVEGTGQIRVLLPVMVVVVLANYIAYIIHKDGIYEILSKLKGLPYLSHSDVFMEKYDIVEVKDVMSGPAITVQDFERAHVLVKLLQRYNHNGFPVVDKKGRFKGLVRRKQIVALMECGIFEKAKFTSETDDRDIVESSSMFSPRPGLSHESSLMHWAFHIKDDRYSEDLPSIKDLEADDYDDNTFLMNIQRAVKNVVGARRQSNPKRKAKRKSSIIMAATAGKRRSSFLDAKVLNKMHPEERELVLGGDETMPSINPATFAATPSNGNMLHSLSEDDHDGDDEKSSSFITPASTSTQLVSSVQSAAPTGFAKVGQDRDGNVLIAWLNPANRHDVVNLGAVMNRGTYCVPDYFPVSKAYRLFTSLGLRWIVVIGSNGEVVGILNRSTLLDKHISMQTGLAF